MRVDGITSRHVRIRDSSFPGPNTAVCGIKRRRRASFEEITVMTRTSLNGCWILDKSMPDWSMSSYLSILNVDQLAIEAHEKAEREVDTYHTIDISHDHFQIVKRSRVNNDLKLELPLNNTVAEGLPNGRTKQSVAVSHGPHHVQINHSIQTTNGWADVQDVKELELSRYKQTLSITNRATQASHTTVRYYLPYNRTPPHLETQQLQA